MAVVFGAGITTISSDWTMFKAVVVSKGLDDALQYVQNVSTYTIFAFDSLLAYSCVIWTETVPDGVINSGYSQAQNDVDKSDFETNYKSTANKPLIPRDAGVPTQVQLPRTGSETIQITHNFCDSTTWWTQSVRVTDETLTDSGDGLTWDSAHVKWIDMTHGKVFNEDYFAQSAPHGYVITVTVDGVSKTQRAPFADSGSDFNVNYTLGKIVFFSSQAGKTVVVSYSYANGSEWCLIPDAGTRIDIEGAEAQFSKDVVLNDSILYEFWGYDPNNLPNKMIYGMAVYKKIINYIDEAYGSYPVIPPIGGTKRGIQQEIYGFPFRYGTIRSLFSSQGLELRVRLANDQEFGGEHATATLYCTVKAE